MSDPNDPLQELTRLREEQRNAQAQDIKEIRLMVAAIERDLHSIKMQHATISSVGLLADRVARLENDKAKIIGGFVALASLQGAAVFITWVLGKGLGS